MRRLASAALILALGAGAAFGQGRAVDGDTIELGGARIRLFGIDAPERRQPGARAATDNLRRLMAGRRVSCEKIDRDRYGRDVSLCRADGVDLSAEQVRLGHAVVWCYYVRRSRPSMLPGLRGIEAKARRERRGIWGRVLQPWRNWGC